MVNKRIFVLIFFIFTIGLIGCKDNDDLENINKNRKDEKVTRIKSGEEITFFIATDIHYLSDSLRDEGEAFNKFVESGDGKELYYIDEITDAFISDIYNKRPEILIISGDLTNNGEKRSHLELADKLAKIEEMGTSVYVIPGNHDILNPWSIGFKGNSQYIVDNIDERDFVNIYNNFGYNEAISRDKGTLSYLVAPSEDVWLLMVDTNEYKNNKEKGYPQGDGRITDDTIDWIKECNDLSKKMGSKITTVMHHSLIDHSSVINEGFTIDNNKDVLKKFLDFDITLNLSGHIHIQDISSYKDNNSNKSIYDIATSSLSVYPQKYGVLKYLPKNNSYDYKTSWIDVEEWSKRIGIRDENLNKFREYSKRSFGNKSYKMTYNNLSKDDKFSEFEKEQIAETIKMLNLNYFN